MNNSTTGIWIGIAILVILALIAWWIFADDTMPNDGDGNATTTTEVQFEDRASSDVASIAASISSASTFASLISSSGVGSELRGEGPYTIFVPTNGAISLLAPGTLENLSAEERRRLIEYHVVEGRAIDLEAVETGTITAKSGDALNFEISDRDEIARVNSSFAVTAYRGSNGVVYVINGVLLPPADVASGS